MKNKDIVGVYNSLDELSKNKVITGIEFIFTILKNKKIFKEYIDTLNETLKPSDRFVEYEQKRISLLKELSTDKDGNLKTKDIGNGNIEYLILPENKDRFNTEIASIKEEYLVDITEQDEKNKSYNSFMDTEATDLNFVYLKKSSIPENVVIADLEGLFEIIEE